MTDEKKLPCKGSKNGLHFPSGHDVAAALGFDHKCGYCKKYYNDADNFLPVSPSKLPWNNALWLLRPILPGNTPDLVKDYLSYCVLVPGPEASRLHQRDEKFVECESLNRILMGSIDNYKHRVKKLCERVKKFEKAARMLLELHHLTQFTTEQKNRRHAQFIEPRIDRETQSKLCDIFELFREAMGEK